MNKTNITPIIFQEFLDSATNAEQIGQAQFFTPLPVAQSLAIPLPDCRHVLCDLTCGSGLLLAGGATTNAGGAAEPSDDQSVLLGCDIDPTALPPQRPHQHFVAADLTLYAQLLHDLAWRADILLLNPPWSLKWHAHRFPFLDLHPDCKTIDSTLATLLLALHFLSDDGECLFICNHATRQRFTELLAETLRAPIPIDQHIWAEITLEGNPCTARTDTRWQSRPGSDPVVSSPARTTILYLKKSWTRGPISRKHCALPDLEAACQSIKRDRIRAGLNFSLKYEHQFQPDTVKLWKAAATEWTLRRDPARRPPYNLWLEQTVHGPVIQTYLSLYDELANHQLKQQAALLHQIQGKSPLKLVLQRAERDLLLQAVGLTPAAREQWQSRPGSVPSSLSREQWQSRPGSVPSGPCGEQWKVHPKLIEAVRNALSDYHRNRAPIIPLPEIQRLGYLEEEDSITCKRDLADSNGNTLFRAGQTYALSTRSLEITRHDQRYNPLNDTTEEIQYTGQELATFITGEDHQPYCFMEARLKQGQGKTGRDQILVGAELGADQKLKSSIQIHFTLHDIVNHFQIPEVPDIAALDPEGHAATLAAINQLESLLG